MFLRDGRDISFGFPRALIVSELFPFAQVLSVGVRHIFGGRAVALSDDALDSAEELEQFALTFALNLEGLDVFARRVGVRRDVVQRLPHGLDVVRHALCAWEPLQEIVEFVCVVQV